MTEAEKFATTLIRSGFRGRDDVVEEVYDTYHQEMTQQEAGALVDRLWAVRLAEQADWPVTTEADRLLTAFGELDANGIVARADFTCCGSCGHNDIDGEGDEATRRGYVFFHQQDTQWAVEDDGMYLAYGAFGDGDPAAVGREIVDALAKVNLPAVWDGSPGTRILVHPLNWQLRLK